MENSIRTLDEATEIGGVYRTEDGLDCHFSPIPNWYMDCGFDCPVCKSTVGWTWEWKGKIPAVTNEGTPHIAKPVVTGAELIAYGHRWLKVQCSKCGTRLLCENFD